MTDKDQITGQTAVGRSVAIPGHIALMPVLKTTWVKLQTVWQQKKISDWSKSGQVKTGPTRPSATPLVIFARYSAVAEIADRARVAIILCLKKSRSHFL